VTRIRQTVSPNSKARILQLLRSGEQSVLEVSEELGLARNTVRAHLANLERENMVLRSGVRHGGGAGKPAHLFQLTPDAQARFSRAYIPLLQTLLQTLYERMTEEEFRDLMDAVGRNLAPEPATEDATADMRLNRATSILEALGATLTTARTNGSTVVEGATCPLGAVVTHHPLVCEAVGTMLGRILDVRLVAECRYDGVPSCRFRNEREY